MSDTLDSIQPRKNSASRANFSVSGNGDNNGCATKSHDHDFYNNNEYDYDWHYNELKKKSTYYLKNSLEASIILYTKFNIEDPNWHAGNSQIAELDVIKHILEKRGKYND